MIHVDFAGTLDNQYNLIVVDSHVKLPEALKCKRPTTNCTIGFLHELFERFGVVDCVVTDNRTQFMSNEFKQFCDTYQVKHITTPQYHPRSIGQAEMFADTFKRALRKPQDTPTDSALQKFLQVCRITPNPNTIMGRSPEKNKIGVLQTHSEASKMKKIILPKKKRYACGEKVWFKVYKNNITFSEVGTVKQRVGELVYIIQDPKNIRKRHLNQENIELMIRTFHHYKFEKSQLILYSRNLTSTHPKLLPRLDVQTGKGTLRIFWASILKGENTKQFFFLRKKKALGRWVLWDCYLPVHGLF